MGRRKRNSSKILNTLPIDARLIPDIISFSHVKGLARVFLMTEMLLAVLVVLGTLLLTLMKLSM